MDRSDLGRIHADCSEVGRTVNHPQGEAADLGDDLGDGGFLGLVLIRFIHRLDLNRCRYDLYNSSPEGFGQH